MVDLKVLEDLIYNNKVSTVYTEESFNEKYSQFLEEGFEDQGLEIENPLVVIVLDALFNVFCQYPGFKFSQIKWKFGMSKVYTSLSSMYNLFMESIINALIEKENQQKYEEEIEKIVNRIKEQK